MMVMLSGGSDRFVGLGMRMRWRTHTMSNEEVMSLLMEAYRQGFHRGVEKANERVQKILQEEGFWDE